MARQPQQTSLPIRKPRKASKKPAKEVAPEPDAMESYETTGTHCSDCGEPQFLALHGRTCKNGHDDAAALEETRPTPGSPEDIDERIAAHNEAHAEAVQAQAETGEHAPLKPGKRPRKPKAETAAPTLPAATAAAPKGGYDAPAAYAHRFVVFGDLHVSAKTLDRCVEVLRRVGDLAEANGAYIVCLGDFWHQRAALSVRQLDAVLRVFREWQEKGLYAFLIPGNHDQVSVDGLVHAQSVFEPFTNVTVATEPVMWPEDRVAFIPWREANGAQQGLIESLEGDGWTVFAHAEIQGATNNHAHAAKGRVPLDLIAKKTRAFYAGHYHKRQKLGDRAWYVGSPFEMDFGERDMPHGVALITPETIEPEFLDFDDFPKHYRIDWSQDQAKLSKLREIDVVEIVTDSDDDRSVVISEALTRTKARDVRAVTRRDEDALGGLPSIAMGLEQALQQWIADDIASGEHTAESGALVQVQALGILAEVADSKTIVPYAPLVRVVGVNIRDFCAVRGDVTWDLANRGAFLLQGAMGVGKTALCDAITWALYGVTSPRGGTVLRADDVIHDAAEACRVVVQVELVSGEHKRSIFVTREKKRGKGAQIDIQGLPEAEGIADQQALIHRVVGMDVEMWRSTVYLGQGELKNFVSATDKGRKDLLARAFNLGACDAALKITRERAKKAVADRQTVEMKLTQAAATVEALKATDFTKQAEEWEAQKVARLEAYAQTREEQRRVIQSIDQHLTAEAQWVEFEKASEARLDQLMKSAHGTSNAERLGRLNTQLGAMRVEREHKAAELQRVRGLYERLVSEPNAACDKCGAPLDQERKEIQTYEAEQAVVALTEQIAQLDVRIQSGIQELGQLQAGGDEGRQQLEAQISETREQLRKCGEAKASFAQLRANRQGAMQIGMNAKHEHDALLASVNPFTSKAAEVAERLANAEAAIGEARVMHETLKQYVATLDYCEKLFSPKGLPVLVLRTVIYELQVEANRFLSTLLGGKVHCQISLKDDDLDIHWFEFSEEKRTFVERSFYQLSGGQRRCADLAFSPFALSEMIFARCGVRVPFLVVDELTTHLDAYTKPVVCELLRSINRETVVVIDHDTGVKGEFDIVYEVKTDGTRTQIVKTEVMG